MPHILVLIFFHVDVAVFFAAGIVNFGTEAHTISLDESLLRFDIHQGKDFALLVLDVSIDCFSSAEQLHHGKLVLLFL